MEFEKPYRTESSFKCSLVSNRNNFEQFTDRKNWTPNAFREGDHVRNNYSKSTLQTTASEYKVIQRPQNQWTASAEQIQTQKNNEKIQQNLINEQMSKFSNRYLYETVQCNRYDLANDYFTKDKPISDLLKTPVALTRKIKQKSPIPSNKLTLVKHPCTIKKKDPYTRIDTLKQEHSDRITSTIDGSPWSPKFLLERSECGWYRKHRLNNQTSPIRRYKPPNLLKPYNLQRITKVKRDTSSFFKPAL